MTSSAPVGVTSQALADAPRLALASRGDALTPYLFAALERRFAVAGRIDPELSALQRYGVAALTVRSSREQWAERFYKSATARRLRSLNAGRQLRALPRRPDAVFQVHALFDVPSAPTVLYIDNTHRQSAEQWAPWNPLSGRALALWYRQERAVYGRAEHLFAFSRATLDSLVLDYDVPVERITVVGAGANFDVLPAFPERPSSRGGRPPTILFVGNDFVRKGGFELLEAFRQVREVLPDARLRLVGALPPVRPQPGVEIVGRVHDRARITALYAEADVFAMPSFFDPFPLVLLEAMALGVPVVAGHQMGVPEIVEDGVTGRLVQPGAVDELVGGLLAVLGSDPLADRWRRAARARVESRFTWDAVVDRMAPALRSLGTEEHR